MTDLFDEMFGSVNRWDVEDVEREPADDLDAADMDWEELVYEGEE